MLENNLLLPLSVAHTENGYKSHLRSESSDESEIAYCCISVDEDFRGSERNTDVSGRHFKFPHREQNPTADTTESHALMVTSSSSNDRAQGASYDNQKTAACLLQGFCRSKLWRSSWILECALHRKGFLFSWILAHSEALKLRQQADFHQNTV